MPFGLRADFIYEHTHTHTYTGEIVRRKNGEPHTTQNIKTYALFVNMLPLICWRGLYCIQSKLKCVVVIR